MDRKLNLNPSMLKLCLTMHINGDVLHYS